ncbi:hypothetical protein CesoFtcFv8_000275 [Champsocephalus esox]|uniref:Claudin n=1 Tax=Champsocephalus esox TaxID=159716 RepID=A0AAN8HVX2_9TELE|nr:hypothetical protein CesoFtcFv8_000275 [Champsocephalus esox]
MQLDVVGVFSPDLCGFLLLLGASLLSLTSLLAPWLSLATDLLPAERFDLSLWRGCVVHNGGPLQCRPHPGLLALPPHLLWARVLTGASLGFSLLALLLTAPGLQVVHSWGSRQKRVLLGVGGCLSLVAGLLVLVPVSHVARLASLSRFDPSLPPMAPPLGEGRGAVQWLGGGWDAPGSRSPAHSYLLPSEGGRTGDRPARGSPPPGGPRQ